MSSKYDDPNVPQEFVVPDEPPPYVPPDVMPTLADVSEAVADITVTTSEIMRRAKASVGGLVQSLGEQIYAPVGRLLAWVQEEVGCVKATPGDVYARCHAKLDESICGLTECASKYQAILERAARKARRQSPCAPQAMAGGKDDGVNLVADQSPPATLPMPMQDISALAGLWLVSDANGVAAALDQLPAEWWSPRPEQPWYITLNRDDRAVCFTPVMRAVEDGCSVAGELYVSTIATLPEGCAEQLLVMLGVPPDAIYTVPPREAAPPPADAGSKGILDDIRARLPDVPPITLPPLPDFVRDRLPDIVVNPPDIRLPDIRLPDIRLPDFPAIPGLDGLIEMIRRIVGSIEQLVRIGDWIVQTISQWIARLRWPTPEEICDFLMPIYAAFGVPVGVRFGCDNIPRTIQSIIDGLMRPV